MRNDNVYLVMYQLDDTHEEIKGVFSSRDKAEEWIQSELSMLHDKYGKEYEFNYWINDWTVDGLHKWNN